MDGQKATSHKRLIMLVSYATIGMMGVYIVVYQYTILSFRQLFLLDVGMMGILIGMQHFGMAVPPMFLGVLSGKIGKKKVVLIAYALIVIGTFLIWITQSFVAFIISLFIIGAGFSVAEATLSAVLADEFPKTTTRHLNFSQAAFSIGAFVGPIISAGLINRGLFFKHLFICFSVLFLVLGVIFLFARHERDDVNNDVQGILPQVNKLLCNKIFLLLIFGILLYVGIENSIGSFVDSYFELALDVPKLSAVALSVYWGAMILSRLLAGIVKIDVRKMFILLSAIIIVSIIAAMLIPDHTAKIALFALCGFGCGPIWPLLMDSAARKNKGATGPALNVMMSFAALGGAVLPLIFGIFVDFSHQSMVYYLCAAAVVAMLWSYLKAHKEGGQLL